MNAPIRRLLRAAVSTALALSAAFAVSPVKAAPDTPAGDKSALRIVVRTSQFVQTQGSQQAAAALQPKPLVDGLVLLPVLDTPRAIRLFTAGDNDAIGLSANEVHALALANTRANLKPLMEVAKVAAPGQVGRLVGDAFTPSRLALPDTWAPLAGARGGVLVVSAPTTDTLLYIGEDTPTAIDALRTLSRDIFSRAPNRLSDMLLRWTPAGWEVVR